MDKSVNDSLNDDESGSVKVDNDSQSSLVKVEASRENDSGSVFPESPEANGTGNGVPGSSLGSDVKCAVNGRSERRKSTRVKKELIAQDLVPVSTESLSQRGRPKKTRASFRFVRSAKRFYRPSGLVDKDWTIEEREKLLDAVSKVASDDYASMALIVGPSKNEAEVKEYINKIRLHARDTAQGLSLFKRSRQPHSSHLTVQEEGEPIERWLRLIDHLVSDNDTPDFSKAIPDAISVISNLEQNQDPGSIKRKTKKKSKPQASSKSSSDSESLSETDDHEDDGVSPINYKLIYEYLYALLRGFSPPPLDPIESWVILDLISDTASELKNSDLEPQKEHLRAMYRDYCHKNYNLKWCNTNKMFVDSDEAEVVTKKRKENKEEFEAYLGKGRVWEEKKDMGEAGKEKRNKGEAGKEKREEVQEDGAIPSTSSSLKGNTKNGQGQQHGGGNNSEISSYHNILIDGLKYCKQAVDMGSMFTLDPLGVPLHLLKPRLFDQDANN